MEILWWALIVAVVSALGWIGFRMEPHWVAKDGKAFTCRLQPIGGHGYSDGRWRDARAFIDDNGNVVVRSRGALNRMKLAPHYRVVSRSDTPPKGLAVYLIEGRRSGSGAAEGGMEIAALRIPKSSRAVEHLDALVRRT